VDLLDSSFRPEDEGERERKVNKAARVWVNCQKLDQVAQWKPWVANAGLVIRGLRASEMFFCSALVTLSLGQLRVRGLGFRVRV
jgi:hypothetical protein